MVLGQHIAVFGGTGSVWGGTVWYLMVLAKYRAVLVGTWWYWDRIG